MIIIGVLVFIALVDISLELGHIKNELRRMNDNKKKEADHA